MSVFMKWLREELDKISESDIKSPDDELQSGDKVVGILESIEVKKIDNLRRRVMRDSHEKLNEIADNSVDILSENYNPSASKLHKLMLQLAQLKKKLDFLDKLFWTCVHYELPEDSLVGSERIANINIDIRKNWQIVLIKTEDENKNTSKGRLGILQSFGSLS